MTKPISITDDLVNWSNDKLEDWQKDALRRLATNDELTDEDIIALSAMIKHSVGIIVTSPPGKPIPLDKSHLGGAGPANILKIKSIEGVKGVGALSSVPVLTFNPGGLTVIYGPNGSGKTSYIRILRHACRTRISDPKKLKILGNVYGTQEPAEAKIKVELAGTVKDFIWKPETAAISEMQQAAVFDRTAAELYVDEGNEIRFLPFGLALPHKLNETCLTIRNSLEKEQTSVQQRVLNLTINFSEVRETKAQKFYAAVNHLTSDKEIDDVAKFDEMDEERLKDLSGRLFGTLAQSKDLRALATWIDNFTGSMEQLSKALSQSELQKYIQLAADHKNAQQAVDLVAKEFAAEPISGVGSDPWRQLWLAAKAFSEEIAYPSSKYPVIAPDKDPACVLCQQPLVEKSLDRMSRFAEFMENKLNDKLLQAKTAVEECLAALAKLPMKLPDNFNEKMEQITSRDNKIAPAIKDDLLTLSTGYDLACVILKNENKGEVLVSALTSMEALKGLSKALSEEALKLETAIDPEQRKLLVIENNELVDMKLLFAGKDTVIKRRNALKEITNFAKAIEKTQTKAITAAANKFLDDHLTKDVLGKFETERENFGIKHLKIALARASGKTEAVFETKTNAKLARLSSDILSEGEQRALALSAYLTETSVVAPSGPLIVDDPVSSLDRERCVKVAVRLADEVKNRQVIVFTHDLIFCNELCNAAEKLGFEPVVFSMIRNQNGSGVIDPSGLPWMGQPIQKRINKIKADFAPIKKLHHSEPGEYSYQIKNLYSRLRDAYERLVEEKIFSNVVTRGSDRIETKKLRYVHLTDALAIKFYDGMTKANTFSHDNPSSNASPIPEPLEVDSDLKNIQDLLDELEKSNSDAEFRRPSMKG
jgi:energy-coupling factor transporter ATP-binding protein EcfA2